MLHLIPQQLNSAIALIVCVFLLTACGGGGGGGTTDTGSGTDTDTSGTGSNGTGSSSTTTLNGRLVLLDPTSNNAQRNITNVAFSTTAAAGRGTAAKTYAANTDTAGQFNYESGQNISFTIGNQTIGPITSKALITLDDLAAAVCTAAGGTCDTTVVKNNLLSLFKSLDNDNDAANGVTVIAEGSNLTLDLTAASDQFEQALAPQLSPLGRTVVASFQPSLGINLEAPQAEADGIAMAIPFADLFRIATPFKELSTCTDIHDANNNGNVTDNVKADDQITYDNAGWPTHIPAHCQAQTHLAPSLQPDSLKPGKYPVIYEGEADITYTGIGLKVAAESIDNRHIVEITQDRINGANGNDWMPKSGLRIIIKNVSATNPVKNIRVVMPGGTCSGVPSVHASDASQCAAGSYQSFEERLTTNRNAIIFNPDYMNFLKDFHTIRMMNLMEASPSKLACDIGAADYDTCLVQEFHWNMRAEMGDASWGATYRTDKLERYGRGAPVEVQIALANQLNRNPWFVLPHNATDDYVDQFATLVKNQLNSNLKAVVEYTNEPWNGVFWAYTYTQKKGMDANMATQFTNQQYWAGILYYAKRSSEVFERWTQVFGGSDRLIRVLNSYHRSVDVSRNMLQYLQDQGKLGTVDAIAIAPYFYGCWERTTHTSCGDSSKIPKVLSEVTSIDDISAIDDIFAIMDNTNDVYGLSYANQYAKDQRDTAAGFGKALYAYEGGQHLSLLGEIADATHKQRLLDLFQAANRDPRMKDRYTTLLNTWKTDGGGLFTLFTLPQQFNNWGSFGIKETLNQSRTAAPKYDASMGFQETQAQCWWTHCAITEASPAQSVD